MSKSISHFTDLNGSASSGVLFPVQAPLHIAKGDKVGVVLLVPGAPESESDIFAYLSKQFMLPDSRATGIKFWASRFQSRLKARLSTPRFVHEYEAIGGGDSINRFNREQAVDLDRRLKSSSVVPVGVSMETYVASPFGCPSMKDAARKMEKDAITHIILLPLFPQFASHTTGCALAEWGKTISEFSLVNCPSTTVWEFAVRDSFLSALNERIDQGLQRFSRALRSDVALLFVAHGNKESLSAKDKDPYCCMVHNTVDRVMKQRDDNRTFEFTFVKRKDRGEGVESSLKTKIRKMVQDGKRAVLVVPVDQVSEQFDSSYLLEVDLRKVSDTLGVTHYHVVSGINCHPLFMSGLTDSVLDSIVPKSTLERRAELCQMACPKPMWDSNSAPTSACSICPYHPTQNAVGESPPSMAHSELKKETSKSTTSPSKPV